MKQKINKDINTYTIIGACNPQFAYEALSEYPYIGTMLPCNIIIRKTGNERYEVFAVNPLEMMQAIDNPKLKELAIDVSSRLERIVNNI